MTVCRACGKTMLEQCLENPNVCRDCGEYLACLADQTNTAQVEILFGGVRLADAIDAAEYRCGRKGEL